VVGYPPKEANDGPLQPSVTFRLPGIRWAEGKQGARLVDITRLKGGSLAGTYLIRDGNRTFIRKECSTVENREYGFYRWFSQLKKLQRHHETYPHLFPAVLDIDADHEKAWFDLTYIEGSVMVSEYLHNHCTDEETDRVFKAFVRAMDTLHQRRIRSKKSAIHLYLSQEVDRALDVCMQDPEFRAFTKHERLLFNGEEIVPLMSRYGAIRDIADRHYVNPWETDTHGNITLENTLYVPHEDRIVFIDLYEENFVDNVHNEYSQVLQSCNSYYELYNEADAKVDGPHIELKIGDYPALDRFNSLFQTELKRRCTTDDRIIVRLYEITQFTRMLPFKMHVARDKMTFFYGLASHLLERLIRDLD
jgi:hypothetical protein